MTAMYISDMASWVHAGTTLGPVKGHAMVGGIKIGDGRERQGKLHMEEYLAPKMWILVYVAFLPGLATMTCPSVASQTKPQRSDPS